MILYAILDWIVPIIIYYFVLCFVRINLHLSVPWELASYVLNGLGAFSGIYSLVTLGVRSCFRLNMHAVSIAVGVIRPGLSEDAHDILITVKDGTSDRTLQLVVECTYVCSADNQLFNEVRMSRIRHQYKEYIPCNQVSVRVLGVRGGNPNLAH